MRAVILMQGHQLKDFKEKVKDQELRDFIRYG